MHFTVRFDSHSLLPLQRVSLAASLQISHAQTYKKDSTYIIPQSPVEVITASKIDLYKDGAIEFSGYFSKRLYHNLDMCGERSRCTLILSGDMRGSKKQRVINLLSKDI